YNFFVHSSIDAAPRRRGGTRRNSPLKRSSSKFRKIRNAGTALPTTNRSATNGMHSLSPPGRMAGKAPSNDRASVRVHHRLTSRISARAATRLFRKSKRMPKQFDTSGLTIDYGLAKPSTTRIVSRQQYEDSTKTICQNVVDHHPIARNRMRYNQKKTARHSAKSQLSMPQTTSIVSSAYNDGDIWSSSSANNPSFELFQHMNAAPLREKVRKSSTNVDPEDQKKKDERAKSKNNSDHNTLSTRNTLISDKENVDMQLTNDYPENVTPRIKSSSRIASTRKSSSPSDNTSPASNGSQNDTNDDGGVKTTIIGGSSNSKKESPPNDVSGYIIGDADTQRHANTKEYLAKEIDQPLPGTITTNSGDSGDKPSDGAPKGRLVVLISKGVHNYIQAANQKAALDLLNDLCISYDTVDGMDPLQKEKRDAFFKVSGIRGNYPQFFFATGAGGVHIYLGGYDWLHSSEVEDLKAMVNIHLENSSVAESPASGGRETRLTILISSGVCDYIQSANQKAALNLLNDLCIPYNAVDGMDPLQREKRDEFFKVSGIRGNYPQLFWATEVSGVHSYLGGYDWLHNIKVEELEKFK
ncbi:hypothetical protein ACHAXR_007419, partial [Thalassiosira sp. AJA248-18]